MDILYTILIVILSIVVVYFLDWFWTWLLREPRGSKTEKVHNTEDMRFSIRNTIKEFKRELSFEPLVLTWITLFASACLIVSNDDFSDLIVLFFSIVGIIAIKRKADGMIMVRLLIFGILLLVSIYEVFSLDSYSFLNCLLVGSILISSIVGIIWSIMEEAANQERVLKNKGRIIVSLLKKLGINEGEFYGTVLGGANVRYKYSNLDGAYQIFLKSLGSNSATSHAVRNIGALNDLIRELRLKVKSRSYSTTVNQKNLISRKIQDWAETALVIALLLLPIGFFGWALYEVGKEVVTRINNNSSRNTEIDSESEITDSFSNSNKTYYVSECKKVGGDGIDYDNGKYSITVRDGSVVFRSETWHTEREYLIVGKVRYQDLLLSKRNILRVPILPLDNNRGIRVVQARKDMILLCFCTYNHKKKRYIVEELYFIPADYN